ncbi:MAG: response regulator transcription factor [SAR202 cluster bacterium]|nr:response regulator transcription factor [SAR202 cluster bacterium]
MVAPQSEATRPAPTGQFVYVVDDDLSTARLIEINLSARGYRVRQFDRGSPVLEALKDEQPDLIILDVMTPGVNGLEVARRVRRTSLVPILVVSVREESATKLAALDLGADDYLTKPFSIDELLARVRALLRRAQQGQPPQLAHYKCGPLTINLSATQVALGRQTIKLTPREWDVLRVLVKHSGQVVSARQVLQQAWGPDYGNESDYVRAYVNRLRRKLEPDPENPRYILSERGMGYRLAEGEK